MISYLSTVIESLCTKEAVLGYTLTPSTCIERLIKKKNLISLFRKKGNYSVCTVYLLYIFPDVIRVRDVFNRMEHDTYFVR